MHRPESLTPAPSKPALRWMTPFAILTLVLSLFGGIAWAQTDQTGVLEGRVVDGDGQPLVGAVVLASLTAGGLPRDAVSGDDGRFRVGFLPPGEYNLQVQADGYRDQLVEALRVSAGSVRRLEVTLASAEGFSDALVVTAEAALINADTTELDLTLDSRDTEYLPIARTATDLVKFTPGASNASLWGGSTSQANSYKLDGVSVNQPGFGGDFLLPNVDWIEEFQVKGLGAGAEYGNFQGGMINMVTKSGNNTLQGGLRLNYEDDSLQASNLDLQEAGFESDGRFEVNVNLAGPLVEDRLFYFVSAQQVEADTRVVDDLASTDTSIAFLDVLEERTEVKLLGKLTWQPDDRGLVSVVLGSDDVETDNRGLDSFTAPAAATTQDSPSLFYSVTGSRTFGADTFAELKLSGYDGDDDRLPLAGDSPGVRLLDGDRNTFRNAVFTRLRSPESLGVTGGADLFFNGSGSISHHLKFGFEAEEGEWSEQRIRNGGLTWRPERGDGPFDPADPSTWGFISSDWGSGIDLQAETFNGAVYAQDYIDLNPRVRLSAGLRYGQWQGDLTPGFGGGTSFEAVDDTAFDPRLGLVADLTGDGRWLAKAHWGRYHQSLFALMFDRVLGGNVFEDVEFWDWVGPGLPDVNRNYTLGEREQFFELFDIVATGEEVGPVLDYEQPFVDQLVLSLEHALGDSYKLSFTYVNRENDNILALVDRNLASNYTAFRNVEVIDFRSGNPVLDAAGNPLVLDEVLISNDDIISRGWAPGLSDAEVDALTFDQDLVLTNADDANREMDQFQLIFDGRGTSSHGSWDFSSSLVYTDLEGNFFAVSGYSDPDGIGAGSFVRPNEAINSDGRLTGTSEWEFKLRFTADLPWGLRGGLYVFHATGEAYAPIYSIDNRNHDFVAENGEFFNFRHFNDVNGETLFLEPRGNRDLDDQTLVDLHLDRLIDLGGSDLVLGFDVFNLLNEDAPTRVNEFVNEQDPSDPSTLFESVRRRVAPRTLRLYASWRF